MDQASDKGSVLRFRLLGVEINVHVSWVLVALLIAWSLASGAFPVLYEGLPRSGYWLMAIVAVIGLAVSIVLHELAHTLVGRAYGLSVDRITLFLFGGVAELHEEPKAPVAELLMAIAGPALSVVLGLAFGLAAGAIKAGGGAPELAGAFAYLGTLNLVLALFNMIPAFPMDGGRVLRAVIWMVTRQADRATRIAARIGMGFGVLLMVGGVALALAGGLASGLWWVLIGLFLRTAAKSSLSDMEARRRLGGHPVSEVMARRVETAPADMTIDSFVNFRLYASHHGMYPVVQADRLIGVVEPDDLLKTPRDQWAHTSLGEVCKPLETVAQARPEEDAFAVLERMRRGGGARMLVVDRGQLMGLVTLQDLVERLALAMKFEPATS
ncbi:MAG: site-2 protease family protein [Phenylobacterium sp.]|uniref:site-2 protease family protein n=1 Tax=Phenylobacterium sp. TaxID=1871053 RepID=UPI00391C543F